jgi:hypothetical protein
LSQPLPLHDLQKAALIFVIASIKRDLVMPERLMTVASQRAQKNDTDLNFRKKGKVSTPNDWAI